MATIFEIPMERGKPAFKMRTDLDERTYVLECYWNVRNTLWHLHLSDADETPLLMGCPLLVDTDLLGRFQIAGLPPGILTLYDTTEQHREAGVEDLGNRCVLLYYQSDAQEIAA